MEDELAINIQEMYREYGPMVHRRCVRLLGNREEASDAMHDVFVLIVRRKDKLAPDSGPGLLFKVATDVCLNRLRSRRRRPETHNDEVLDLIASADEPDRTAETRSILDRIFRREQPSTRVIAVLHFVDGMTLEEVARVVGLSVSGVRKRLRVLKANSAKLQEVVA